MPVSFNYPNPVRLAAPSEARSFFYLKISLELWLFFINEVYCSRYLS